MANPSYSKRLEPEPAQPEREVLFSPIDADGVDRSDAPEGFYAVKSKADNDCSLCALFPSSMDAICSKARCFSVARLDGRDVVFKPVGEDQTNG